jgi:hypothetical protein
MGNDSVTWQLKAIVAAVVIAVLAGAFWMWLEAHDAQLTSKFERAQLIRERDEAKARESDALAQIDDLKKKVRDPEVIVREIPQYVPFHVESTPSQVIDGAMAPPQIVIKGAELPKLWDYVQNCRACEVKLAARDADVANLQKQIAVVEKSKKNTFWNKAKWLGIGIGVGAAGYAASR